MMAQKARKKAKPVEPYDYNDAIVAVYVPSMEMWLARSMNTDQTGVGTTHEEAMDRCEENVHAHAHAAHAEGDDWRIDAPRWVFEAGKYDTNHTRHVKGRWK